MRASQRDAEFGEYFAARSTTMRATAYLLCGDWHQAEDITQVAFVRLYAAWDRVARRDSIDAYVRQIIVRTFLNEKRRPHANRERITSTLPETATPAGSDLAERLVLRAALQEVPARQRAVLVLRYWEDLAVNQVAEILGCAEGTVKSQAQRGLATLRTALEGRSAPAQPAEVVSWGRASAKGYPR